MNKTALITGGAGFIGSHVTDEVLDQGLNAIVLDDLSGGFKENVDKRAKFIEGSVTDTELVKAIFEDHDIDYVYHLAAYAAEGLSHFIKKFNFENNVIGSINLINASVNHNVECFIFTSSIAVYGKNQLPMTEDLTPQPEDSYGIAKYCVELELEASRKMFDLDYIIFRPHNVYGEKQNLGDKYRNVIGIFMNEIMSGNPLTIFGDGEQTRAFSYIKDVAPIIARSPFVKEAYNDVFNVGADINYTVNDLAREVIKAMGSQKTDIIHLEERNEVKHAYSDHAKQKKIFDHDPQYSLEKGLQLMSGWAKDTGVKKSKDFGNIEIEKNLPPSWRKST